MRSIVGIGSIYTFTLNVENICYKNIEANKSINTVIRSLIRFSDSCDTNPNSQKLSQLLESKIENNPDQNDIKILPKSQETLQNSEKSKIKLISSRSQNNGGTSGENSSFSMSSIARCSENHHCESISRI